MTYGGGRVELADAAGCRAPRRVALAGSWPPGQQPGTAASGRAHQRPRADVYAFALRQAIPDFPVPLLRGDSEPAVPLNQLVHELYDRAGYDLAIDYSRALKPPLTPEDAEWAASLLQPQK